MRKSLLILVAIVVGIGVYAALHKEEGSSGEQPIKVGAMLILSGDFAKYGESSQRAIQIAVDRYNNDPSNTRKVEIVYEDTKADPKTAVSAYQKLTSLDHVDVIVGPLLQTEVQAIYSLVAASGIPVFAPSVNPIDKRDQTSNPLSIWPDPTIEAGQMAQYVFGQGIRTVAVLSTRDSWEAEVSESFVKKFAELGGTVTDNEVVLPDSPDSDLSLPVTKVINTKPEAVFVGTYYKFTPFVDKLRQLGYKGKLYSIEIDNFLSDQTKPYSNGLQFISPESYTDEFIQEFQTRHSEKPTLPAGQAYDAMSILLSIVPQSKDQAEILQRMADLREFRGVSGTIEFTDKHRAVFPLSIFEVQNGIINHAK